MNKAGRYNYFCSISYKVCLIGYVYYRVSTYYPIPVCLVGLVAAGQSRCRTVYLSVQQGQQLLDRVGVGQSTCLSSRACRCIGQYTLHVCLAETVQVLDRVGVTIYLSSKASRRRTEQVYRLVLFTLLVCLAGPVLDRVGVCASTPYLSVQQGKQVLDRVGVRSGHPPDGEQVSQPVTVRPTSATPGPSGLWEIRGRRHSIGIQICQSSVSKTPFLSTFFYFDELQAIILKPLSKNEYLWHFTVYIISFLSVSSCYLGN